MILPSPFLRGAAVLLFVLAVANVSTQPASAQAFDGLYTLQTATGVVELLLESGADDEISGAMSGNGVRYLLAGTVADGIVSGQIGEPGASLFFTAQKTNGSLMLTMSEMDAYGNPNPQASQSFQFQPVGETTASVDGVVINGTALSAEQVASLAERYGIEPLPGNYWYDATSGLFGVVGYPSYGFMYPGHDFGQLEAQVSNGNTGVFVNGRQLPQLEWAVWSYMLGSYIQPGRYWLDGSGNAGYEGNPTPTVNLYAAAQQNAYGGQGGSGDNFWSSRFGAGNSDQGGSRGYVSVPGHGPIGYGF